MNADALRELLATLDANLNDLMLRLYRTREALTDVQQRVGADVRLMAQLGQAIASARDSERVLAGIQRQIASVRQ